MSQGAKKIISGMVTGAVAGATRRTLMQVGSKIVKKYKEGLQKQKDYKADKEWKQSKGVQVDVNSPMYSRFKNK